MQRSPITLFLFFFFLLAGSSYIQAQEGVYNFDKRIAANANGISVELNESAEYVEAAIRNKFEKLGKKKPKGMKKGIYLYESVVMPEITEATLNYYYRVESVGSGDKTARISFFLSPGNDNFMSSDKYPKEMKRAEQMLYGLQAEIVTIQMQEKILAQKELISEEEKNEKNMKKEEENMLKEVENMLKEIEKLEKKIVETKMSIEKNQEEQLKQAKLIEGEQKHLRDLIKELELMTKR